MLARHIHHAICSFLAFVFVAVFAEVPDWTCSPPTLGHIGLPRASFEAVFFPRGSLRYQSARYEARGFLKETGHNRLSVH
ncbi:hypothetical protein F5878DRAFT_616718 [Lentinula raphanica]|uniref:Secreted protein n=1 Tax=Lentinula raphanica TaxID=153919 RepID=A0AA38PAI8_9AGAR|nr:hypothetical protein F5878DRAFT_616718 [Lentinula raphanica]